MEKITEINNKEGRRLALIAGRAAFCAVNIHSISDAKKKEKSALYYPNVPPRPGAVISVSIKAILQSWCKIYIVLCSQTFKIWPFPLRVSRFYIIPLQLYHHRDKSASKRFKIGFLVLSGWNILFFHHSRALAWALAARSPWSPGALALYSTPRPGRSPWPPRLLLCCCLSPGD